MEYKEFEELFFVELKNNNIKNVDNKEKFFKYMKILLDWNNKINLTAITDEKEFIIKHFIDSLSISKYLGENEKIIDVGTGAGFPGLPLKLFNEKLSVTLIDSVNKKVKVLKDIIDKLQLENIDAIHARAEEFIKENREKYDIAVSRAVANMNVLVEYLIPYVKVNGIIICMKGPNYKEELELSQKAISVLGGKCEKIEKINIGQLERNNIIIRKVKNTPKEYPRIQSKILKNPIE